MDIDGIVTTEIPFHLTDCFQKRQTLDISDSPSDFDQNDIRTAGFCKIEKPLLYFISDMGNHLHSTTQIRALTFFLKNRPIDFPCRCIIRLSDGNIQKSFVMTQIKIGLRTIVGNEYFTVLVRIHGSRIHIDVWIEFQDCYVDIAALKQTT